MLFSKYYLPGILSLMMGWKSDQSNTFSASPELIIPEFCISKDLLILDQLEGKWYYQDESFSGLALSFHANGSKAEEVKYYQGKKEGMARKWYPDGTLQKESYYRANHLDGVLKLWSPSPEHTLVVESNYVNGARHGLQRRWFESGQLQRRTNFNLGTEEGLQQAWLENGKIYVNYEAKNGRTFGLRKANLCYELEDENIK